MDELYYSKGHIWVKVEGDTARLGIAPQFIEERFSEIAYIELPEKGDSIEMGEPFGEIEADEEVFELIAPISGVVTNVNEDLLDDPELLLTDPLREGWLLEVSIENPEELDSLLSEDEYEEFLEESEELEFEEEEE